MNVQTIILAILKPVSLGCIFGHWSGLHVLSSALYSEGAICISRGKLQEQSLHVVPAIQGQKLMQEHLHLHLETSLSWLTGLSFSEFGTVASPHASGVWTAKRGPRSFKETPGLWLIKFNEAAWLSSWKQKMSQSVLVWTKARNWPSCNQD